MSEEPTVSQDSGRRGEVSEVRVQNGSLNGLSAVDGIGGSTPPPRYQDAGMWP